MRWSQKPEIPKLRKHCGLVLERPILEVENEAARHAVAPRKLNEVAVGDDGAAVERPKDQKPPNDALHMAHGHGFRLQSASSEVTGDEEQRHTEAPFHD